jgi:hypothetical protein
MRGLDFVYALNSIYLEHNHSYNVCAYRGWEFFLELKKLRAKYCLQCEAWNKLSIVYNARLGLCICLEFNTLETQSLVQRLSVFNDEDTKSWGCYNARHCLQCEAWNSMRLENQYTTKYNHSYKVEDVTSEVLFTMLDLEFNMLCKSRKTLYFV